MWQMANELEALAQLIKVAWSKIDQATKSFFYYYEGVKYMLKYKVYLLIFPNGKQYCGYTSQELKKRWSNGHGYDKCPLVHKAIKKYGWENIDKKIIATFAQKEYAFSKERQTIAKLHLTNPEYGYNIDQGGRPTGAKLSEQSRKKLSESQKKRWASPGYKEWMNERRGAILHTKKHPLSEEHKKKISETKKGSIPVNRLQVIQVDKKTNLQLNIYESATAAAISVCGNPLGVSNILAAAKGKRHTAYGYKWQIIK